MNNKLEALVQRRTSELQKTLELLKDSRDRAVGGFRKSANLLSSMIHLFQRDIGNHARRVALLCEQMIPLMKLQGEDVRNLMMAAYFHEIGKVGRQDTGDEPVAQEHYAEIGENLISQGMGMKDIGTIIRHHREHFDGSGRPDGLAGEAIPLSSRILKVLAEYDWMIHRDGKSVQDALAFLLQHSEQLYDPLVVTRFHQLLRESGETNSSSVPLKDLKPGMELMSDIFLKDGVLFLPGKTVITAEILERIDRFRDLIEERKGYYIRPEHEGSDTDAGEQKNLEIIDREFTSSQNRAVLESSVSEIRPQAVVARVSGALDGENSTLFLGAAKKLIDVCLEEERGELVIDLHRLTYASSAGIGIMMSILTMARASGVVLLLANPTEKVSSVMHLLGFESFFSIISLE